MDALNSLLFQSIVHILYLYSIQLSWHYCLKTLFNCVYQLYRHRDILQGKVSQGKFSNWIRGRRGRVSFLLEPSTNQVWRGEEIQTLKKIFFNHEKREINTFENFPWEFFPCKISLCHFIIKSIILKFELFYPSQTLNLCSAFNRKKSDVASVYIIKFWFFSLYHIYEWDVKPAHTKYTNTYKYYTSYPFILNNVMEKGFVTF